MTLMSDSNSDLYDVQTMFVDAGYQNIERWLGGDDDFVISSFDVNTKGHAPCNLHGLNK